MNFGWVYPEDSGEYICRATNLYGSDETRAIIKTAGRPGIVYESQLPHGMASIDRIREMEAGWQRAPDMIETEQERFKPCFVTKPEEEVVGEGDMARFVCRVTGYPKPRVMWLLNGQTVINVSKTFLYVSMVKEPGFPFSGQPAQTGLRRNVAIRRAEMPTGRRGKGRGDRQERLRRGLRHHHPHRQAQGG